MTPQLQTAVAESRLPAAGAILILVVISLYAGFLYLVWAPRVWSELRWNDFGRFYYAMHAWVEVGSLYGPTISTPISYGEGQVAHFWNLNPPHSHVVLWPFKWLDVASSFSLWMAVNAATGLAAARWAMQETGARWSLVPTALLLVSAPVLTWAITGQLSGLLALLVTAIWVALRRGQWSRAGLLVGLACSLKPFLGVLFLYLIVRRKFRAALIACAAGMCVVACGVTIFGIAEYWRWISALRDVQWIGAPMNASVSAIIGRTWSVHALVVDSWPLWIGTVVSFFVLSLGLFRATRVACQDTALLIVLTTALLASPLGWVYYVGLFGGPLLAVWTRGAALPYTAIATWLLPPFVIFPYPTAVWAVSVGSLYSWGLLIIWAWACFGAPARSDGRMSAREPDVTPHHSRSVKWRVS